MVANLLSLSRLDAGVLTANRVPVDVGELVGGCVRRLDRALAGHDVVVDVEPDVGEVPLDHLLVDQALGNLLENAARHTPPGGRIAVSARRTEPWLRIAVEDAGPGVPAADAARIFEPFRSGTNAGVGGIGLAICRAVADAHAGTIDVRDAPGGGARFLLDLPLG
jgi:two-component system sensor histidine kinase KdpD